jgi:PAS domain S-box-containing protein
VIGGLTSRPLRVILVADDEDCLRQCLHTGTALNWQVSFQRVGNESELAQCLASSCGDVIIVDLRLKALDPAWVVRMGKALVPVVVLCDEDDEDTVVELIHAGAATFVYRSNLHRLAKVCKRAISKALGDQSQSSDFAVRPVSDADGILAALLQEATDSIVVKDREGRYLLINPAGADFLGRPAEEIIGKTDFELFTPETAQRIADSDQDVMMQEKTQIIEDLLVPLAGETRTFQAMKCVYRGGHGQVQGIINVVRDISLKRQAEEALKESEQRFRMMADAAPAFIWMTDEQGHPTYFNKQWRDFTGQSTEEMMGGRWVEPIHPDDWATLRTQGGESFLARQPLKLEFRLRCGADGKYYWILAQGIPRFNPDGSFAGYIGSCVNIHEQKMAQKELSDYTVKLHHSNQELEQFATVASHDLQAPLRKVMMFSDAILTSSEPLSAETRDYLERMQRATRKMQELITDLLNLSRINRKGQPFQPVQLESIVQEVLADLLGETQEAKEQVILDDLNVQLEADPLQIQQLVQNLVENALKFRRENVPPRVRISAHVEQDRCVLSVADNGIGFDEKYTQRIFGVFERLHGTAAYEGSGMGLAICKKIVERHNGTITATSVPNEGSTFVVTLPLHQP